jgi:murein DD-endopeptidase MepM/ murein hydrolase activator NlpD
MNVPYRATHAAGWITASLGVLLATLLLSATQAFADSPRWVAPIGTSQIPAVIEPFDPPPQRWQAGHRGVDLAANEGDQVRAAGAGTISYVGLVAGRGVVTVSHGELRTTYEPVETSLATGTGISPGQVLGFIGTGGHCSQRCLHWGLLRGEDYLDPMMLLQWEPPVLKSLTARTDQLAARSVGHAAAPVPPDGVTAAAGAAASAVAIGGSAIGLRRLRGRRR